MSTNTFPSSSKSSPKISPPTFSTEIVEIEENTSSSLDIVSEQNEDDPITTEIAVASSIKNLFSSVVDVNESKKNTLKKAVNFVISTGRMTKRLSSYFSKDDDGESSRIEPTDNMEPVEQEVPELYKNPIFKGSKEFRDLEVRVDELDFNSKSCLYCFSVFPLNAVIKRRVMIYWWMGESFIRIPNPDEEKVMEDVANELFDMLITKGFIVPIHEKWNPEADSCRMDPFVRLAVITLAERFGFFNFDEEGNPTTTFSGSNRACLVGKGFPNHQTSKLGRLETLFNCSEYYLDFKSDLLFRMKRTKVLYLGLSWQASVKHHIEVDDEEFLKGLKNMKFLRLFSLQGVSGVTMLPNDIFSELQNLLILDLRTCHSLESIPLSIGCLQKLTHLDISGCYLLEYMPKSISSLSMLQVLKGFLVLEDHNPGECTLEDLAECINLRKLNIFTFSTDFPDTSHLTYLNKFCALRKLTIEWGESRNNVDSTTPNIQETQRRQPRNPRPSQPLIVQTVQHIIKTKPCLPDKLTKLDLLCLPHRNLPKWLNPCDLPCLKKLYIRGALIVDLGQFKKFEDGMVWDVVEVLRLKHMPNLDMDWRQFRQLFPCVIYLEKLKCPKLTLFPCDARGTWMKKGNR